MSRFLYPVFLLRILFYLFGLTVIGFFTLTGYPAVLDQKLGAIGYLMVTMAILIFLMVLIMGGKTVIKYRYQLIIYNGSTEIVDLLFRNKIPVDAQCKGYSLSKYGNLPSGPDFKMIIFYLHNGRKIEFPQFLYWNFKDIHPALQQHGIHFLGTEPYRWKNPWSRKYQFDRPAIANRVLRQAQNDN